MTPEEAVRAVGDATLKEMLELVELAKGDPEAAHSRADELMANLVRTFGRHDIADAYDEIERWCA